MKIRIQPLAVITSAQCRRSHRAPLEPDYTVRYEAINAMLLNEFLKEHHKVEEQQAAIVELKSVVAQQQKEFRAAMAEQRKEMENVIARLKAQEAKIQKVNDKIELAEPAPQVVANNK